MIGVIQSTTRSVLVVDDHWTSRRGIRLAIEKCDEFHMSGEATSGLEAVDLYFRIRPDIAVLDLNLPGLNGMQVARRILSRDPSAKLVLFSACEPEELAATGQGIGFRGFLSKGSSFDEIIDCLRQVAGI